MEQFCMEESEGCSQENIRFVPLKPDKLGLQLELPEGFYPMPEDRQLRYYPRKGRPELILENNCSVQITIQLLKQQIKSEQIRYAAEELCLLTEELFPKYKLSPVYLCEEGKLPIGWFLMEMTDMGKEHIKVVSTVREKMILLTFTYPNKESIKWRSIIRQSFRTLEENGDMTDGEN